MNTTLCLPKIGEWYQDKETGTIFEVIVVDEQDEYVEVQFFSGEIEEYDLETWFQLILRSVPEPEDCSGAFELNREDYYFSDHEPTRPEDQFTYIDKLILDLEN